MAPTSTKSTKTSSSKSSSKSSTGQTPYAAALNGAHAPIVCTSRQSRFHTETIDSQEEIDLKTVNIAIGDRELLVDADLKLKAGVKYALIGRNGTGKSTLLQAIAKKLIPGIGQKIRILLLSQIEDATGSLDIVTAESSDANGGVPRAESKLTALEHVVRGDAERSRLMHEATDLNEAVESGSAAALHRLVLKRRWDQTKRDLFLADLLAKLRSGARGWDARAELVKAEAAERAAQDAYEAADQSQPEATEMDEALSALTQIQLSLDEMDASKTPIQAAKILSGLGFTQEMMDSPFSSLSGGWRSRCSLAISLLIQSDVLLLDEPSNYLDLEATLWLESHLSEQDRTVVITSHDQAFLENVVQETILIRNRELRYYDGTPKNWEVDLRKKRKSQIKQSEAMDKKREHIEKSIEKGKASAKKTGDDNRMRMVKSRQKKLDERWGVEQSAKGGRFKLNRDLAGYFLTNRAEIVVEEGEPPIKVKIPDPPPLRTAGDLVHFDDVSFRYPKSAKPVVANVTFTLQQGGRMSFVGQNGQGKSTLAKLIMGELKPTTGNIVRHPTMRIGYFSQHSVEELTSTKAAGEQRDTTTALQHFMEHVTAAGETPSEQEARACLGSFGLPGKLASDTPIRVLSGGQKVRLALAEVVFLQPHLLLLDEVTTHVDAATIQAIGMALRHYSGGLILVTHDRWFNKVVIEGESPKAKSEVGQDDVDSSSGSESSVDEDEVDMGLLAKGKRVKKTGKTWRVSSGKVRLMERGMDQYVEGVERKLAKRAREAEKST